jgi:hypothetical protein
VTGPVRRFHSLPLGRRQLLELEVVVVAALVVLTLLVRDSGAAWEAVALAALGYAVGLTAHVLLVLLGWEPRLARRRRQR